MKVKIGTREVPIVGINDEVDDRKGYEGTCKTMKNWRPYGDSIVGRGGWLFTGDYPEVLYYDAGGVITTDDGGTDTGFTWLGNYGEGNGQIHFSQKFEVSRPERKIIHIMAATYSNGSKYYLRFLMKPYWDGTQFVNEWKDITPYYIDLVGANDSEVNGGSSPFDVRLAGVSGDYLPCDLIGGYIYLEDSSYFGATHVAEGDKITGVDASYVAGPPYNIDVTTENAHTWDDKNFDAVRVHKNLATGKYPYNDFVADTNDYFKDYTITAFQVNEEIVLSVHAGETGRASFMMSINYVKRTLFGVGKISSKMDYIDATADPIFSFWDKRLCVGYPGASLIPNPLPGFPTVANGIWIVVVIAIAKATLTLYDQTEGKISGLAQSAGIFLVKTPYWIDSVDFSLNVNDFVVGEFDLHGRFGSTIDPDYGVVRSSNARFMLSSFKTASRYWLDANALRVGVEDAYLDSDGWITDGMYTRFSVMAVAVYSNYRYGLHQNKLHTIDLFSGPTTYGVNITPMLPFSFNRNIVGITIVSSEGIGTINDSVDPTLITHHVIKHNDIEGATGWTYALYLSDGSTESEVPCFIKSGFYNRTAVVSALIGGNHLVLTGAPAFKPAPDAELADEDGIMKKDYSFGSKANTVVRGRLFSANAKFQEYQLGAIQSAVFDEDKFIWYTPIGEFGSTYHLFASADLRYSFSEIGSVVALALIGFPQGLLGATQPDQNNLLILGTTGYKFVQFPADPDAPNQEVVYRGDTCIARRSVVTENGTVFCAGAEGVYMFQGSKIVDISKSKPCSVKKTWRELAYDLKAGAIGVYYRPRNQYQLYLSDGQVFIFDLDKLETDGLLRIYQDITGMTGGRLPLGAQFIDNNLYLYFDDGSTYLYDPTKNYDTDEFSGTLPIVRDLILNNIKPDANRSVFVNAKLAYSTPTAKNLTVKLLVDNQAVNTYTLTGTDQIEILRPSRAGRVGNDRGERLAVEFSSSEGEGGAGVAGNFELHDLEINVREAARKRPMTEGA